MNRWTRPGLLWGLIVVLLVCSVGVNVLQARRIRAMVGAKAGSSAVGRPALPVEGFSPEGTAVLRPVASDLPTVLYYFSPTCSWCERNWDNIRALERESHGRYRVLLLTRARDVREYMARRGLTMDVVEGVSDAVVEAYGFSGTPQTMVASIEGVVTHDWRGAFTSRIERQIEELFDLVLPGVAPPLSAKATPGR